ncbi:MAG: response regulator transcription factor [Burkholderiales bacterium]|nr:response regulator transcription factor [Burkholderiales bacterium]
MSLSILIVDDEAPARRRLRDLLSDIAEKLPHTVCGEAASGAIAAALVADLAPDVVLADMQMPNMTGIELAQHLGRLENPPAIIFVTAHDEYAVRAFEVNALDYLMKPVRAERLAAALAKAAAGRKPPSAEALARSNPEARRHLSIAERGRLTLVPVADIVYLRAELKYITVRTEAREYLLEESLSRLEEEFAGRFVRVHRSALIARERIAGFERAPSGKDTEGEGGAQWQVVLRGVAERVPVSRRLWAGVKGLVREP